MSGGSGEALGESRPRAASGPDVAGHVPAAQLLAAIVDSSEDAIISKSAAAVITSWNAGAERLYGYTAAEAVGRPISMLLPPELAGEERRILDRILAGERVDHYETERVRKDGRRVWVSLTVSPLRDTGGTIVGASVIARDVTARRAMEERRRRLQAVTEALSEAITLEEVVAVVLREGLAAFGAGAGAGLVAVVDDRGEWLEVLGMAGAPEEAVQRWPRVAVDADLPLADAFRSGRAIWLADAEAVRSRYHGRSGPSVHGALAAVPLSTHGSRFGALGLSFAETSELDADDREFVLSLAQQCAQARERARLLAAEQGARAAAERAHDGSRCWPMPASCSVLPSTPRGRSSRWRD